MQEALLRIESGGTSVRVPTSVLFSIVAFLLSLSLAAGYFLNEPAPEQADEHDRRVAEATTTAREAAEAAAAQLGVVRATREELRSLDEEETLALAENQAHTDRRVYAHRAGNVPVYGLKFAPDGGGQP
jgi:F0F1-type ATP synthase membrane subunit b/b'